MKEVGGGGVCGEFTVLAMLIGPNDQGEMGLYSALGLEGFVWNTGAPLRYLSTPLSCG